MRNLEEFKGIANKLFLVTEKYNNNQCSYDRALEDIAKVIAEDFESRRSLKFDTMRHVLQNIKNNFKQNKENGYLYNGQFNKNDMDFLEDLIKIS